MLNIHNVFDNIYEERQRQDEKWAAILSEEVGEASQQALFIHADTLHEDGIDPDANRGSDTHLRTELIQIAAVAFAWIEAIDRRTKDEN